MSLRIPSHLLAIDIETTTLDVDTTDILEVGLLWLDAATLTEIDRSVVLYSVDPASIDRLEDVVREMHTGSGLLDDCEQYGLAPDRAEAYLKHVIETWTKDLEPGSVALMGSGIAHFDALIIQSRWPWLAAMMPYWYGYDISYTRRLFQLATGSDLTQINQSKNHRALDDLDCHLAEMREFVNYFRTHSGT